VEQVSHHPERGVFELTAEGVTAGHLEYVEVEQGMAITTVQVQPRFGGRGYGSSLAEAALHEARERGVQVLPYCSFVQEHLRRNPAQLDLVPEEQRSRFGLAA
jgi:predicted GNAT family acetyltransferase